MKCSDTIETIGDSALRYSGLHSFICGDGLVEIESNAFAGCSGLYVFECSRNLQTIGDGAFSDCVGLTEVSLGGMRTIGAEAFRNDGRLSRVRLNEGLESIYENDFEECISLENIYLPDSITTLGLGAFMHCRKLVNVNYPLNWTESPASGCYVSPFFDCPGLTRMDIPEGAKLIPQRAFAEAQSFAEITLPESLVYIAEDAFEGCGLDRVIA